MIWFGSWNNRDQCCLCWCFTGRLCDKLKRIKHKVCPTKICYTFAWLQRYNIISVHRRQGKMKINNQKAKEIIATQAFFIIPPQISIWPHPDWQTLGAASLSLQEGHYSWCGRSLPKGDSKGWVRSLDIGHPQDLVHSLLCRRSRRYHSKTCRSLLHSHYAV